MHCSSQVNGHELVIAHVSPRRTKKKTGASLRGSPALVDPGLDGGDHDRGRGPVFESGGFPAELSIDLCRSGDGRVGQLLFLQPRRGARHGALIAKRSDSGIMRRALPKSHARKLVNATVPFACRFGPNYPYGRTY